MPMKRLREMGGAEREEDVVLPPCGVDLEKLLHNCFPYTLKDCDHASDDNEFFDYFCLPCPVHSSKKGRVDKEISEGEFLDVISFLNTKFLITGDGAEVDVQTLKGKYVVVCCVLLPLHNIFNGESAALLWDIFNAASAPDCPFQLVIVPKRRAGAGR